MRTRWLGVLAALALLLAACNDGNDGNGAEEAADDVLTDEPAVEAPDVDLDDDTAAAVNGSEIPQQAVDERVDDALAADDELAAQLEGEEGEQLLAMFRAQTLTILIQTQIILDGAADMGVEPTEEDVAAAREELVAELGGEEEFDDAVAQAGISEQALDDQLRGVAALDAVGDRLADEEPAEEAPDAPEGTEELDPADVAVQQWLGEQVGAAEVTVHPDYGQWEPQSGQVLPAGGPVLPEAPDEE